MTSKAADQRIDKLKLTISATWRLRLSRSLLSLARVSDLEAIVLCERVREETRL